jgi:NitT/TauT family transport system substrate-binding protein
MPKTTLARWLAAACLAITFTQTAQAQDRVRIALSDFGTFPNIFAELGTRSGIFKKHNIAVEPIYTQGGGETFQAVLSNSVDIGVGLGTYAVFAAAAKGAPLRIVGNAMVGADDLRWYVRADSPIKTPQDFKDRTVAYSTSGSSTAMLVREFATFFKVDFKAVAAGSPTANLTQVMSGQIDVGWGGAPDISRHLEEGKIRVVLNGNDVPKYRGKTVRLLAASASFYAGKPEVLQRFLTAYRETVKWAYADPDAIPALTGALKLSTHEAETMRGYYPAADLDPDNIEGLDALMKDAVELKFIQQPLNDEQMKALFVVPIKK